ncbi:MAG TPA: SUMF1/EgtB/PvdO family nonheme iron enzyme [Polyangiaceae bacterium]|nr:SUMF1/EgtB/PvdO family nonheme iron enzyme [Polyangiaceae bacterium]
MPEFEHPDPFQLCGTTIEGKYKITTVVGDGGFGVVYRAVHQGFDEPVAVKCLKLPGKLSSKERDLLLAQLRDEGKLLLRLSRASSGIVQALDIGAFTTPEGLWVPYLILEWLEGDTLAQYARKRKDRGEGPLSIADTAKLLEPAFKALAVAHAQKVAHRDVKPQNLFLAQVGSSRTLKVLDFGIAKVLADHPTFTQALAATNLGPTAFTPRYGAPEQFNKKRGATGPWTDVFALALIVVELASGKQALEGDDATELYIASADPSIRPTLRSRGMKAPEAVERALAKALSVEPKHRFADAGEFWDALSAAVAEAGAEARTSGPGGPPAAPGPQHEMLSTAEFAAERSLDVATDVPSLGFARTEVAAEKLPTLPMTQLPTEGAPKLAPTVPGAPYAAGLGEPEARAATVSDAALANAPTMLDSTRVKEPTVSPEEATVKKATAEPSRSATPASAPAGGPSTPEPQTKTDEPTRELPTRVAAASHSTGTSAAASAATADKSATSSGARATEKDRESAPAASSAKAEPPQKSARTDDPMAETPLADRAPQMGEVGQKRMEPAASRKSEPAASRKSEPAPARKSEPAASKKPEVAASKKPEVAAAAAAPGAGAPFAAAKGEESKSSGLWIFGGLAAVVLGGVVVYAMSGGEDKPSPSGKPTASASAAVSPKPKPTAKPTASATASAAATADAAPAPIVAPEDMIYVPPGAVKLGEGDTAREVTLSKGFFIDRNEVTVHAYQACLARRMCSAADHVVIPAEASEVGLENVSPGKDFSDTWSRRCNEPRKALDHPVNCVDYSNAESYCRFRGRRLPTEAEWERAARGEGGRPFAWGAEEPDCGRACFDKNGVCLVRGESVTTCTAGSHPNDATPDGLYDLSGNVAEWVADGFAPSPAGGADPKGDPASPRRVVRGGSFLDDKEELRATYRVGVMPGTAHVSIGFRCAMDVDASPAAGNAPPASPTAAPTPPRPKAP